MIRWDVIDPEFLSDADLIGEHCGSEAETGDPRQDALAAEIERRHADF
jgi:hypothetical protein